MKRSFVIGVYGVSGSGKSHRLSALEETYKEWRYVEGSEEIARVMQERCGGTLDDFKHLSPEDKAEVRSTAAKNIRLHLGVTVVAGHFSFPVSKGGMSSTFETVFTEEDKGMYDAIIYLDIPSATVLQQRASDSKSGKRAREDLPLEVLSAWATYEKANLPRYCTSISQCGFEDDLGQLLSANVTPFYEALQVSSCAALCEAVGHVPAADLYLLIDGDRTITPQDTGRLFFEQAFQKSDLRLGKDPLKDIFKRYEKYEFRPFLEVAMLYDNALSKEDYKAIANKVGSRHVKFFKEWTMFLERLPSYVHPILLSSSIRESWVAALREHGLFDKVTVIAGNHVALHDYFIDPQAKATVVEELRRRHPGCLALAFGDSPIDFPMLQASDRGYIVTDPSLPCESTYRLIDCLDSKASMYQIVLPSTDTASAADYCDGLQVASLTKLLQDLQANKLYSTIHFTGDPFARILATNSRRDDIRGPGLQAVHFQIGQYLSSKLLQVAPGLIQSNTFLHVQQTEFTGLSTMGSRVAIIALMRGGEPLARGVYDTFPDAQFVHYTDDSDLDGIDADHIIVVDSVINNGTSIRKVLAPLATSSTRGKWHIYVLVGVMQEQAALVLPKDHPRVRFLALRVSKNQYKGQGGTDTGNRLFGTF